MVIELEDAEPKPSERLVAEARELLSKATPGPWFWNVNLKGRCVNLESQARGSLLETVMDFTRWGTGGAAPRFRDRDDTMRRMEVLTVTIKGREHHAHWYQTIDHPDAALIARAPDLLSALCNELEAQVSLNKVQAENIATCHEQMKIYQEALRTAQTAIKELHDRVFPGGWIIYTTHSPEWKQIESALTPKGEEK